ncbi:jg9368 [Pararge aegeria aegeria]|uniref:Jg9368 protein n=1 Tax=Pararge aegeria aegeria TaxID=348720 RepID=A0A8S4S1G7_9NEOP|nr:jg9368 [Pararge aegeria aegeria]
MSQDVCHRHRRSLNEFRSRRAKKTRAKHARVKSGGAGATPREAATAPAPRASVFGPGSAPCDATFGFLELKLIWLLHII